MTAHTPGPWTVDRQITHWHGGPGCGVPALAILQQADDMICRPVAWVHPYLYFGDPTADATLIAAAPELLAALKPFVEGSFLHGGPNCTCAVCDHGRAAIAKAEGR